MANEFGVSRTVVREALRMLEHAGLVEIVENRGALVRNPSLIEILHLYDIRAGLARTAGRLIAQRASRVDREILRASHEQMRATCEADDHLAYDRLNVDFHDRLLAVTGNARLKQIDEGILKEVRLFVRHGVAGSAGVRHSYQEHGVILDAIEAGDPNTAAAAFENHILQGKSRMIENLGFEPAAVQASGYRQRSGK